MDNTRIITYIKDGVLADALYEDGRMMELSLISKEQESILGNIYIGKVKNIVKNIQAAFVEIEHGMLCYLPLEDARYPVYTKPKKGKELAQGDELLVQVSREAVKTKAVTDGMFWADGQISGTNLWKPYRGIFRETERCGENQAESMDSTA